MSKKNIDELFREQFRDFDEIPDEKVWEAIENSLDKKSSKKIIPIWWKLGGVAAALAILFYLINPFANNSSKNTIEVTSTPNKTIDHQKENLNNSIQTEESQYSNSDTEKEKIEQRKDQQEDFKNNPSYVNDNTTTKNNTNQNGAAKNDAVNKFSNQISNTKNDAIVNHENTEKDKSSFSEVTNDNKTDAKQIEKQNVLADNQIEKPEKVSPNIVIGDENLNKNSEENALVNNNEKQKPSDKKEKKSIFDEIGKEEETIVENKNDKWSVGPSIAPVYFNGIGTGSPINDAFVRNSKSGNVNLSYGVSVAYEVSKKLKLRSGVHKVDYGYSTNQIEFKSSYNELSTSKIDNITYKQSSKNIVVNSQVSETSNSPAFANDVTGKNASLEGNLLQQFGYVEVPLELNYALVDKRFGINLIGGVSSLFLVNNDVLLNSGDQTTEIGEANNINDVNFSTNFGFGVDYKITPKLQFNVEPMFKYQLNTFSDTAGQFQPFSIGVYSGISFKF